MGGNAVQLIGGKEKALDAGDPVPIAEKFKLAGEVAVVDLDAALGTGSNKETIKKLIKLAPCRVGGGIRTVESALEWLDAGAEKIVLGTAATPEVLSKLPRERVIAALDAYEGEVVVEGWQKRTGQQVLDRIGELEKYVSGFLVTFVEREGRLGGADLGGITQIIDAARTARITFAGGITTADEIGEIDRMGADAQVGMALYTNRLSLADAIAAPLRSDRPDGLWPTIVADEHGVALGLAWSNAASLQQAVNRGVGVYFSRTRGLWVKGETSGSTQELRRIALDCDRDALRFTVRQRGSGFCHYQTRTCFGDDPGLDSLLRRLLQKKADESDAASYTRRLLQDSTLLRAKLIEEAGELADAKTAEAAAWEAADLIYFTLVTMAKHDVSLSAVEEELKRRSLRLTRRPGNAKPQT